MEIGGFDILLVLACLFFTSTLYFTLTFFQYLKEDDLRGSRQAKLGAVICFALGFAIMLIVLFS